MWLLPADAMPSNLGGLSLPSALLENEMALTLNSYACDAQSLGV